MTPPPTHPRPCASLVQRALRRRSKADKQRKQQEQQQQQQQPTTGAGVGMGDKQRRSGSGPTVIAPLRDQVYGGGPLTEEQKAEGAVVSLLALVFAAILVEGVFLAASVRGRWWREEQEGWRDRVEGWAGGVRESLSVCICRDECRPA